jgi:two-component system cell cycle sensor histidine kinase/response regulator CckA
MTTLNKGITLQQLKQTLPLFLALVAAGLVGNYFKFSILNADFIFGSIFAMLALQFFGFGRGILAAAIIASYTYLAWNHPYAMITMTAEVAVVGYLFNRKKISLLMADALYWLFIGIPLGYFCFTVFSNLPASNSIFLMTKQAINGIANALVARMIITGYALHSSSSPTSINGISALTKLFSAPKTQETTSNLLISFREILSNLLAFFVLCTALIMLVTASRSDFVEIDHRIRSSLIQDSHRVTENLENWVENRKLPVVNLAQMAETLSPSQMQPRPWTSG